TNTLQNQVSLRDPLRVLEPFRQTGLQTTDSPGKHSCTYLQFLLCAQPTPAYWVQLLVYRRRGAQVDIGRSYIPTLKCLIYKINLSWIYFPHFVARFIYILISRQK